MRLFKGLAVYSVISLVILSCLLDEAEGRRKILRGRKTITREYYKPTLIPAWSIVLIVGVVIVIFGAGLYFVVNRVVLGRDDRDYP